MKNIKITWLVLVITFSLLLTGIHIDPASASFSESGVITLASISEGARVAHAKELLGAGYFGSEVEKTAGKRSLNELIYKRLESKLSLQWKGRARSIASAVILESSRYNFDPVFVLAVIQTESKFNPLTVGQHGEIGLMQIKPETAKWIAHKFNISWKDEKDLKNPEMNIKIGSAYLSYLREKFDTKPKKYVSAYNMGPKALRRILSQNLNPTEYNSLVMKHYAHFYSSLTAQTVPTKTLL